MKLSLAREDLQLYIIQLLTNYLPSENRQRIEVEHINLAIERTENSFTNIHRKYYNLNNEINFNHFNSDHMVSFLWFLSNVLSKEGRIELADQLSYLNKIMHSIDAWHNIDLPDIFLVVHPLGTVLGNASYQNFLVVYQNVTIGANIKNEYPTFNGPSVLYSKASVIGKCDIGENVILGANSLAINKNIENNSVYIGNPLENKIQFNSINIRETFFDPINNSATGSKNRVVE